MIHRACPVCKKAAIADYRPFCSRRCADVDLQRWLTGRYTLGEEGEDDLEARPWAEPGETSNDR